MKKLIFFAIILTIVSSCAYYPVQTTSVDDPIYSKWKAEQRAINEKLLKYSQSDEFKKQYVNGPTNTANKTATYSIVGTNADPFVTLRNTSFAPTTTNRINVNVSKSSFDSNSSNYNISVYSHTK